jgi:hypothetical protein
MGEIPILMLSAGGLFLLVCAGLSLVIKAWALRPQKREATPPPVLAADPPQKKGMLLEDRLEELKHHRFSVPARAVRPPLDQQGSGDVELRPPEDYKGPFRRTPHIRRTAKPQRYYNRRQDPEILGRRGQRPTKQNNTDTEEKKE